MLDTIIPFRYNYNIPKRDIIWAVGFMLQDATELSKILSELADLKSELDETRKKLNFIKAMDNKSGADTAWCNAVTDGTDAEYLPYETDKLTEVKKRYLEKLSEARAHENNRPEPKEILQNKVFASILSLSIFIVLCILCGGAIIMASSGKSAGYWGVGILVCALVVDIIYILALSPTARAYWNTKKINNENNKYNSETYPKLCTEYRETLKQDQEQCEKLRVEMLEAINENIEIIIAGKAAAADEAARLSREIEGGRFSLYSAREYSIEQLKAMSDLLSDGRADNYKEALNLYLREVADKQHREEMLRLEREKIAADKSREKQIDELKKQAEKAESAAKAATKSAEAANKQAREVQKKFDDRCKVCKKYYTCGKTNCTGYVPK